MTDREFHFSVDNQLLSELGERLVAKNYIALAELIKNAYDADADHATVSLNTSAKGGGEITITDVGQGMTAAEVERYWMRVATDHKIREPRTAKYGRFKSGSKGIGRFACRRLAKQLELKSVARSPNGGFEVTTMTFNWTKLKAGKDLANEPFVAHVTKVVKATPGLTLRMTGLTEKWTQRDFNILRRSLVDVSIARAERRKGYQRDPGFSVKLKSDEFATDDTLLSEQYLNAGWGRLVSSISAKGFVDLRLQSKNSGTKTFVLPKSFVNCRDIEFDIAWIPGEKDYWRDPKLMTNAVRRQLEDTEGGVKVYFDGFRVYPYGESGTDWLDISRKLARRVGGVDKMLQGIATKLNVDPTRALLDHPKDTTLVGKIVVPPTASDRFVVKMDREGFVENEAFLELKQLVQLALEWMTVQYVSFKQKASEERLSRETAILEGLEVDGTASATRKGPETPPKSPQAALNAAIAVVETVSNKGIEALKGRGKTLSTAANIIRRSTDVMDAKLAKLQILASTGPVVFAFAHEIKSLIARLATHANELEATAKAVGGKHQEHLNRIVLDMRDTRKRLDQEVELFGTFSRSLAEDKPSRHSVRAVVDEVVSGFSYLNSTFGIEVDRRAISPEARTQAMRSAEVYSLIVNLYSNALKACMASNGKLIAFSAKREAKGLVVQIRDTGVGLQEGYWERVFEPLVADPENKIYPRLEKLLVDDDVRTLGKGSGLGLSIVRDVATSVGGRVRFIKPNKPWRACVELVLP